MLANCPTAQLNPNPDIRHFKAEKWCSSYYAMENIYINLGFFTHESSYATARLSYRNSVHPSVTWVDQAKTVQARISKSSPSAAWKTIVSGTVKLFRKLEGGHPERGR